MPRLRRYRGYSLRLAVTAFILLPCMLLAGLAAWLGLAAVERQGATRMQEDIELVTRAMTLPLSHALANRELAGVESVLLSAGRIGLVYGVYVYDEQGRRIASTGTPRAAMPSDQVVQLATGRERGGDFEDLGDEEVYSYFQPLTDAGGRIIGLLQVTRRGSDFEDYLSELRGWTVAGAVLLGLLLTGVIFLGHHRAVGRHVSRMERAMDRVAGGDLDHRIGTSGPWELRALSGSINRMLDGVVSTHRELVQRRAAEITLKEQLAQSEKLAAVGQLAAGVAHELGTPLATVDASAQRGLRHDALDDPLRRAFERIRGEVARMEHIVRQLMDFARRNPLRRRPEHASRLIQCALSQLAPDLERSDTVIETPDEDHGDGPALDVDRIRVEQALVNLVRNAMQATPRGRVRISWFDDDEGRGFIVEDDGPGIPESVRPHLFEPFYTTKTVGEGTGLGLSVVHAIAETHGGRISVDESPLGGASFRLLLNTSGQPA